MKLTYLLSGAAAAALLSGATDLDAFKRVYPDPQRVAIADVVRARTMFKQTKIAVLGLLENMAGYICPHCGEASDPFGTALQLAGEISLIRDESVTIPARVSSPMSRHSLPWRIAATSSPTGHDARV